MRAYVTNKDEVLEGGLTSPSLFLQKAHLEGLLSLALVGLSKNAGKTTCLNHLICAWQKSGISRPLGITSIGRDGEEEDVVNGQPKPRIFIFSGTYLATAKSSLSRWVRSRSCRITRSPKVLIVWSCATMKASSPPTKSRVNTIRIATVLFAEAKRISK